MYGTASVRPVDKVVGPGNVYVQDKIETEKNGTILNLGVRYDFLDPRALRPALELIPKSSEEFTQEVREFVPARFKSPLGE